jgi:hypothetical protein
MNGFLHRGNRQDNALKHALILSFFLVVTACGGGGGETTGNDLGDIDDPPDDVPGDITEDALEDITEDALEDITEDALEDITDETTGGDTNDLPDGDDIKQPPADLDLAASGIAAPPESTPADGLTQLAVTVSLVDINGNPLADVLVRLEVENANSVVVYQPAATDEEGVSVGYLVAIDGGTYKVSAGVLDGEQTVYLENTLSATFEGCTSTADYYRRALRGPVFSICSGCHNEYGFAKEWGQDLWQIDDRVDDVTVAESLETFGTLAKAKDEEPPWLLGKPSGQANSGHYGGTLIPPGSAEYAHLAAFVARLQSGDNSCDAPKESFFDGVELMSPKETLHRAALMLTLRSPTDAEIQKLETSDDLEQVIEDDLLEDPNFYLRLQDLFNDLLFTDRKLGLFKLNSHLAAPDYPNRFYFRPYVPGKAKYNKKWYSCESEDDVAKGGTCCHKGNDNNTMCSYGGKTITLCQLGDEEGTQSLRRQALALIAYVVKNDKPFTEILTANYAMVNPLTARIFRHADGTNEVTFDDDCDLDDYKPVKLSMTVKQGVTEQNTYPSKLVPHAGIFSTHTFLNRYTDTSTNLNRHRSSQVFNKLLDIDIQKLVTFTVGQTDTLPNNPTKDGFSCSVCHSAMDPLAGAFVKWTGLGRVRQGRHVNVCTQYLTPNECVDDEGCDDGQQCVETVCVFEGYDDKLCVRPKGYKGKPMPASADRAPLRWMSKEMAADPRFASTMVKVMLTLLTARDVLTAPTIIGDPDYAATVRAYLAQEEEVARVTKVFVAENYNLKKAIVEIVKGSWFRAKNAVVTEPQTGDLLAGQVGGGRLLTPYELNARIRSVTGFPWITIKGRNDSLLSTNTGYRLLYGGIDSYAILDRTRDPFTLASNVARRMSNEMACLLVPQDLAWNDAADRLYFSAIEVDTVPLDGADGEGNPINIQAVQSTIEGLHKGLLNEVVTPESQAYKETYDLFVGVWQVGQTLLENGGEESVLPVPCRAGKDYFSGKDFEESASPNRSPVKQDGKYVIRAWMAVVSYLLSDAGFLLQ